MRDVVGAIGDGWRMIAGAVRDYVTWRDDWNRTWSPVSYFLMVFAALILIVLLALYGAEAWDYRRGHVLG